jgi:hypothetical protein
MAEPETLETKRAAVERKLAALRATPVAAELVRQADAAVSKFRADANALEAEIAEIDSQLGVRERDSREKAAAAKEQRWLEQRAELLRVEELRLKAVADAEAATRALVDAINRALEHTGKLAELARALSANHRVPSALSVHDLAARFGGRIAGQMQGVKGFRARLGSISWTGGALFPAGHDWKSDEESRMANAVIGPLIERGRAD